MADIFISYARADRDKVEQLAAALEAEGWSVWWDRNIQSGAEFSAEIERELHAAQAVIVCWSEDGAKSRWVRDEATLASRENKLKTISLDGSEPPIGYMQYHALDMSGWKGGRDEAAFEELRDATRAHFERLASGDPDAALTEPAAPLSAAKKKNLPMKTLLLGGVIVATLALVANIVMLLTRDGDHASEQNTADAAQAAASESSIAVLPFIDLSPDKDQEYFSDGISEELLNVLAQINGLQVAGRTSSFAFKDDNRDLREIGQMLNVSHILEGSVRKAGDKVRITAQLIKADNGFHLWSKTYDRELTDIFAIQDEIAGSILAEMRPFLPGAGAGAIKTAPRANIEAYELFLKAREIMTQIGGEASYEEAVGLLDQAIAIDPAYAPALAWRAYAEAKLSTGWAGEGEKSIEEARPIIKDFADRALAADPASPDAQFALGAYYLKSYYSEGADYLEQAKTSLRKAIALRPNFSQAKNDLAYLLGEIGEHEEAIALLESVLEHDAGHRDANENYIYAMESLGRFEEAQASLEKWIKFRPTVVSTKLYQADLDIWRGDIAKALALIEDVDVSDPDAEGYFKFLNTISLYALGDKAALLKMADHADSEARKNFMLARIALLDDDAERAAEIFEMLPNARSNPNAAITGYIAYMSLAGRHKEAVSVYEEIVGTPEAAIAAVDACGCGGIDTLVVSLRAENHPHAEPLLKLWDEMAARKAELFARSWAFHHLEGDRHLLHGDEEAAARSFALAIDTGWRSSLFANRLAWNANLPETPAFDALRARMRDLIDAERKKLDMAPL